MQKVLLKHERLLVNLFYHLLSKGITKPVTEKQYFAIINETLKKINVDELKVLSYEYVVEDESFEDIIAKANALASCTRNSIEGYMYRGCSVARPTYNLSKPSVCSEVQLNWYTMQQNVFHRVIDAKFQKNTPNKLQTQPVSQEQLSVAKKVAAVFVDELIKKYVNREIKQNRWPAQCREIDEYVFKRNIAKCIDEQGTAEIFCKLYNCAIQVVCNLIRENKGVFQISNWDVNTLAFANYLKFFELEEFKFLIPLKHNQDEIRDLGIRCSVSDSEARCFSRKCTFQDEYDGDDSYEYKEWVISEKEVQIMEKRLSYMKG